MVRNMLHHEHMEQQSEKPVRRKLNAVVTNEEYRMFRVWATAREINLEQALGEAIREWTEAQQRREGGENDDE
jgi:hypothetical protein